MFKKFNEFLNESSFSGQMIIKKDYNEIADFKEFLAKKFQQWSFKVINTQSEHPRIKGQTLTYSSSSATKDEIAKVKELITQFSEK